MWAILTNCMYAPERHPTAFWRSGINPRTVATAIDVLLTVPNPVYQHSMCFAVGWLTWRVVACRCIAYVPRDGDLEIEMHSFTLQHLAQRRSLYDCQDSGAHADQPQSNAALPLPLRDLCKHL